MQLLVAAERIAVSCAAGRRLKGGGQREEAAARQCACGRPLECEEHGDSASAWRLRIAGSPTGRSALPGESRPAQGRASGVSCTAWLGRSDFIACLERYFVAL